MIKLQLQFLIKKLNKYYGKLNYIFSFCIKFYIFLSQKLFIITYYLDN